MARSGGMVMNGRRIYPVTDPHTDDISHPGDYWKWNDVWHCVTPTGLVGDLTLHDVTEYEDGTITVQPSILVERGDTEAYHGFLVRVTCANVCERARESRAHCPPANQRAYSLIQNSVRAGRRPLEPALCMPGNRHGKLVAAARTEARRHAEENPSPSGDPGLTLQSIHDRTRDQYIYACQKVDQLDEGDIFVHIRTMRS